VQSAVATPTPGIVATVAAFLAAEDGPAHATSRTAKGVCMGRDGRLRSAVSTSIRRCQTDSAAERSGLESKGSVVHQRRWKAESAANHLRRSELSGTTDPWLRINNVWAVRFFYQKLEVAFRFFLFYWHGPRII